MPVHSAIDKIFLAPKGPKLPPLSVHHNSFPHPSDITMQNDKERKNFQWRSNSSKNAKRAERFATPQANLVTSDNLEDFGFVSKGPSALLP